MEPDMTESFDSQYAFYYASYTQRRKKAELGREHERVRRVEVEPVRHLVHVDRELARARGRRRRRRGGRGCGG